MTLNLSLYLFNLFMVPILDGGQLLAALIDLLADDGGEGVAYELRDRLSSDLENARSSEKRGLGATVLRLSRVIRNCRPLVTRRKSRLVRTVHILVYSCMVCSLLGSVHLTQYG